MYEALAGARLSVVPDFSKIKFIKLRRCPQVKKTQTQFDRVVIDGRHVTSFLDVSMLRRPNNDSADFLVAERLCTRLYAAKNVVKKLWDGIPSLDV